MEPIPHQDGGIPITPPPEQPKPQELPSTQFVSALSKTQEKIDDDIASLYPKEEPDSEPRIRGVKKETRVFHRIEIDSIGPDKKPTGSKRVVIVSSRPSEPQTGSADLNYAYIVYDSNNPEIVKFGLLGLRNGKGGNLYPEQDLFSDSNNTAVDYQTRNTGGVFGTIIGKIDTNQADQPEKIQLSFKTAFEESIKKAREQLKIEGQRKIARKAAHLENVRIQQELLAKQEAEKDRESQSQQKVFTDAMDIFDEPEVEPVQTVEPTPSPVNPPQPAGEPTR